MVDSEGLRQALLRLDGRNYGAYKSIPRTVSFDRFTLQVDHVQGDPFAAPSRLCLCIPWAETGFLDQDEETSDRLRALCDFVQRSFAQALSHSTQRTGSGKSGLLEIAQPGQEVLERSGVVRTPEGLEIRLRAGLPAQGRRILGRAAAALLCNRLPEAVETAGFRNALDPEALRRHLDSVEDSSFMRRELKKRGWIAFVANGACLPRKTGVDDRPLQQGAIPFQSPGEREESMMAPRAGEVRGMAIPRGVTLLVGGGYHGKSTLLQALQRGIYDHIPGDGREQVVTDPDAVAVRAEDGRAVAGANIQLFISDLPGGRGTSNFSSADASGSTSQAAAIVEAIESGASALFLDEDTCATNFMIRDPRMQALIHPQQEPITPFVHRLRWLYEELELSIVLVMGGSGQAFDAADFVLSLDHYKARDRTEEAKAIAGQFPDRSQIPSPPPEGAAARPLEARVPQTGSLRSQRGRKSGVIRARGRKGLGFGTEDIDLSAIQQLVEEAQVRAIGEALIRCEQTWLNGSRSFAELLDVVDDAMESGGLDALCDRRVGDLSRFRRHELAAALNRLRSLVVRRDTSLDP